MRMIECSIVAGGVAAAQNFGGAKLFWF